MDNRYICLNTFKTYKNHDIVSYYDKANKCKVYNINGESDIYYKSIQEAEIEIDTLLQPNIEYYTEGKWIKLSQFDIDHLKIILEYRIEDCKKAIENAQDEWNRHEQEKQLNYATSVLNAITIETSEV